MALPRLLRQAAISPKIQLFLHFLPIIIQSLLVLQCLARYHYFLAGLSLACVEHIHHDWTATIHAERCREVSVGFADTAGGAKETVQ